jgi:hypothetical protein
MDKNVEGLRREFGAVMISVSSFAMDPFRAKYD